MVPKYEWNAKIDFTANDNKVYVLIRGTNFSMF